MWRSSIFCIMSQVRGTRINSELNFPRNANNPYIDAIKYNRTSMSTLDIVMIDYNATDIPAAAKLFKPKVYKGKTGYCCLLGPIIEIDIFGCGCTPLEAVMDWDHQFNNELASCSDSQGIIRYIREQLEEIKDRQ